ncbi:hypothetical protein FQR65_LT19994 [Abscondita terminalis]|nr:hypothetical protein FQR65_LT19994 [Abscondita terminalis]
MPPLQCRRLPGASWLVPVATPGFVRAHPHAAATCGEAAAAAACLHDEKSRGRMRPSNIEWILAERHGRRPCPRPRRRRASTSVATGPGGGAGRAGRGQGPAGPGVATKLLSGGWCLVPVRRAFVGQLPLPCCTQATAGGPASAPMAAERAGHALHARREQTAGTAGDRARAVPPPGRAGGPRSDNGVPPGAQHGHQPASATFFVENRGRTQPERGGTPADIYALRSDLDERTRSTCGVRLGAGGAGTLVARDLGPWSSAVIASSAFARDGVPNSPMDIPNGVLLHSLPAMAGPMPSRCDELRCACSYSAAGVVESCPAPKAGMPLRLRIVECPPDRACTGGNSCLFAARSPSPCQLRWASQKTNRLQFRSLVFIVKRNAAPAPGHRWRYFANFKLGRLSSKHTTGCHAVGA